MVFGQIQFGAGTQHALGLDTTQLGLFNFDAAGQLGARLCQWRLEPCRRIGCTANNLDRLSPDVNATYAQLARVGVWFSRDDLRHNHATEAVCQRCHRIHLQTCHGERVRQRLGV